MFIKSVLHHLSQWLGNVSQNTKCKKKCFLDKNVLHHLSQRLSDVSQDTKYNYLDIYINQNFLATSWRWLK